MPEAPDLLAALEAAHAALDTVTVRDDAGRAVGWAPASDLSAEQLARAVRLQAELEGRVAGFRLHTIAAAEAAQAQHATAATDTQSWAAAAATNRARTWGAVWLADLLESKYHHVRAGLATGRIAQEHAEVIVRAAEKVPAGVTSKDLAGCEEALVAKAASMTPGNLRRAARRLLAPLNERLADAHEQDLLIEEERRAELYTALSLDDNGDGSWTGRFTIPELHAHLLKNALEKLSGPRCYRRTKAGERVDDATLNGRFNLSATEALGAAFCEILEHLPEHGHARTGVTLVVHVDEDKLREQVGSGTLDTGTTVSVGEVRRLACGAGILPMVLNGASVPLDLGMSQRLFTKHQALALSALHTTCAAEGCDRPFAWCELHHQKPWSEGGPTDLANAVPLCWFHHRRVHDTRYEHEWLPDHTIRFRHRWRSRWKDRVDPWDDSFTDTRPPPDWAVA